MSNITTRIRKYNAKYSAANLTRDLTAKSALMTQRFAAQAPLVVAMETSVKQLCDGAGVSVIELPYYLCFGRELYALTRKEISGETAAIEAALLIAKWTSRGLTSAVLQGIRTDVFSIVAPIAP
jgi:hypothetical protein